jgi:hypothetical protein
MSTTASTAGSTAGSLLSSAEERKCSKDWMANLKILSLPTSGEALRGWVLNLKWSLLGNCWSHDGIHATNLTTTTAGNKLLSNNLLTVFKKSVMEHFSTSHQCNDQSLLQDNINDVDGMSLITQGKGFEMYQLCIVTHGNQEDRIWEKSNKVAPVKCGESSRIMTSMAVQSGRHEKQGDCKNAFCQSYLPKDGTIILGPPRECKPGDLRVLNKTLYGLCESPYHWYQSIKKIFLAMGLTMSPHNPCVFFGSFFREDLPPIYIGIYVDDFK